VLFDDADEFRVGLVLIKQYALHGQIRCVDLEHKASVGHGTIFVTHLARDRVQIGLVGWIISIEQRGRDAARRRFRHETFGKRRAHPAGEPFEPGRLGGNRCGIVLMQLVDGSGRVEHLVGARNARQHLLGRQRNSMNSLA
jgi:hypothetical protein